MKRKRILSSKELSSLRADVSGIIREESSTPITPEWLVSTKFQAEHGGKWVDFSNSLFVCRHFRKEKDGFELHRWDNETDYWVKIVDLESQEHLLEVYKALRIQLP